VRDTAVVVREDEPGHKRLVAYVVPVENGAVVGVSELRAWLRERLPDYMVPAAWMLLPELPLNVNGKVDRRALPAPDAARPEQEQAYAAPRNPVEQVVSGMCAEVLGIEQVGILDNFFELGGHSLLATQLISRLRDTFQIDIPLRSVFECADVARLCEALVNLPDAREKVEATAELLCSMAAISDSEAASLLETV
jgi:acyl carrier protein